MLDVKKAEEYSEQIEIIQKSQESKPLLELKDVKSYYPIKKGIISRTIGYIKAVDGVSLSVYPGESLGLVGESGCGKSTLGRSVLNIDFDAEISGSIKFSGENISGMKGKRALSMRRQIQMIFQDPFSSLPPRKRVTDIISEPLSVHHLCPENKIDMKVESLLASVGLLPEHKNRYPNEFSGGQRQRIGIARALALDPKMIICDEPVSALDVSIQAQILNLLKDLQAEFNLTFLFIAHGLGAVKYVSNRVAVMYMGKIVEIASTKDIFSSPYHPYTRALLSAYPVHNPHLRGQKRIILSGDVPSSMNPPEACRFASRCPIASERCYKEMPLLSSVSSNPTDSHQVACFKPQPYYNGHYYNI